MSLNAYTLHLGSKRPPLLLREGFSTAAFLLAPFWALRHGLWLALLGYAALSAALIALAPGFLQGPGLLALHLLAGFEGRDLLRARLARQGRGEAALVLAPDEDTALWRALSQSEAARHAALRPIQGATT